MKTKTIFAGMYIAAFAAALVTAGPAFAGGSSSSTTAVGGAGGAVGVFAYANHGGSNMYDFKSLTTGDGGYALAISAQTR